MHGQPHLPLDHGDHRTDDPDDQSPAARSNTLKAFAVGGSRLMSEELATRWVKQTYFHGVDSKNWDLFGSVFD